MVILDEVPFYPKKIESRQPVSGLKAFASPLFNALLKRF
jgi:hypothetical protein